MSDKGSDVSTALGVTGVWTPQLYCLIGVASGALLVAVVFFLTRRDSKIGLSF